MKQFLLFVLMLAMVGCAGFSTHQKVAIACESAASALETLTAGKVAGQVSSGQLQDAVGIYERAVTPVCVPVVESMSDLQKVALKAAVEELVRRAGGVK